MEKNVGNNKCTFIQYSRAVIKGPWQLNWKIEEWFSFLLVLSSSSITMCLVFRFKPVSLRNFSKKHFCNADPVRTFWRCQKCFYITSTWIKQMSFIFFWKRLSYVFANMSFREGIEWQIKWWMFALIFSAELKIRSESSTKISLLN